ncbi:MAG TPA: penicillin-binding protein 2 [Stellaceae bacterium]|nr:penicillin-binding protein 2 [Stellaceae bacterium]
MKAVQPREENPCRPRHFKPASCGPLPVEGPEKQSLEMSRTRLLVTGLLFSLAFLVIGLRLAEVMLLKDGGEPKLVRAHQHAHVQTVRADIVDRNGVLLATTLDMPSLYANPKQVIDAKEAARQLVAVLPDLNREELLAKLTSDRSFVWIKRQLTPEQQFEVNKLGIPGLQFETEHRRLYPKGSVTAHVVGFAGIDNKGLAGIERGLDDQLTTSDEPVQLSIDIRLQYILKDELQRQIQTFSAEGGMGLITDVNTGEILAMVSLPDFDPNDPGTATPDRLFNRATLGTYEMGSVFKIFNTAMALDDHVTTMSGSYDATNPIHIGRFTIHDDHAQRRWLTVPEIFMYSSNIGSAKMALDAGIERQQDFLRKLGLLQAPTVEIREIGEPLVPRVWHQVNSMTIAFGHGISVSPLQMVIGVGAVVDGGVLHHATFLKRPEDEKAAGIRVMTRETSEDMRRLMRLVVEKGTGKFAAAPGYLVGGKTGTAEKVSGKGYARKELLSSFIGVFPINDPRYLIMISVDEPHGVKSSAGYATGGWVAAPAVSRIVERMAPIMGIPPVDEDSPEIRRALLVDYGSSPGRKLAAN